MKTFVLPYIFFGHVVSVYESIYARNKIKKIIIFLISLKLSNGQLKWNNKIGDTIS